MLYSPYSQHKTSGQATDRSLTGQSWLASQPGTFPIDIGTIVLYVRKLAAEQCLLCIHHCLARPYKDTVCREASLSRGPFTSLKINEVPDKNLNYGSCYVKPPPLVLYLLLQNFTNLFNFTLFTL